MLRIPGHVWSNTLDHFRTCGAGQRECVAYWVGPAMANEVVDEAVHPGHVATRYSYQVDNGWLNGFWIELARRHRSVRAQVHTHAGVAGHSPTDDKWALVYTPGFLSVVLPDFGLSQVPQTDIFVAELDTRGRWNSRTADSRLLVGK